CGGRVVVVRILPGSAAERAGLRRGDEVVGFGGISLRGLLHFQGLVLYSKVGQRVRLTIRRGGRVLGLEVVIEARRGRGGR
ncbi:MAG: PDZ domain-containing protein, partial [Planctomycetota bacterium]